VLELAIGLTGRVLQPLYVESTDDELERALAITSAGVLVAGGSQGARARRLHANVVDLEKIVRLPGTGGAPHAVLPADVEPFDTRAVRARLRASSPRALGETLLYMQSTGTTGPARVIELSEEAVVRAVWTIRGESSHPFPRFLSFLPTAHISERFLTLYVSLALAGHTWFGGGLDTLADDLRACRPTILLAPPLLLEALRAEVAASAESTSLGRRLLASVQKTADALMARGITGGVGRSAGAWVFGAQMRRQAGLDRVRDAIAGTAPLPPSLHAWFEAAGIPLRVVYGQTELAGATSMTARRGATFGSVGTPVAGVEVALSANGEMFVRGPSVFARYVGDLEATSSALAGGWLHSGDRAKLLPTGEILLLGRVQSLVTAADGTVVDTAVLSAEIRAAMGEADVVFARATPYSGVYLYVALHAKSPDARPIAPTDVRWDRVASLIEDFDPHHVVRGHALFEGAFGQATGEVGPTGKPRAWRIHDLRSASLRMRPIPRTSRLPARPYGATG
jgi:long-chain acyl-CoA synthetase